MKNKHKATSYEGLGDVLLNLDKLQLLIERLRKDDKNEIINR